MLIDFEWAFDNPHLWKCNSFDAQNRHPNSDCEGIHYGSAWPINDPDTWDNWTDGLGSPIWPGCHIAIATVSGRSPQMVVAELLRINRKNSRGELHKGDLCWFTKDGKRSNSNPHAPYGRTAGATFTAKPFYARFDSRVEPWGSEEVRAATYQFQRNIIRISDVVAARLKAEANK